MWKDLSKEWKETYELAWLAFRNGSLPVGCIITDALGDTIIAGRNETGENHKISIAVLCIILTMTHGLRVKT